MTFELVDGRAILLDPAGREVITLNHVGTLVWEAADGSVEETGLARRLGDRFPEVPIEQIESDVIQFLGELRAIGLIVG